MENFPNRGTSPSDSSPSRIGTWCFLLGELWFRRIVDTELPHFPCGKTIINIKNNKKKNIWTNFPSLLHFHFWKALLFWHNFNSLFTWGSNLNCNKLILLTGGGWHEHWLKDLYFWLAKACNAGSKQRRQFITVVTHSSRQKVCLNQNSFLWYVSPISM